MEKKNNSSYSDFSGALSLEKETHHYFVRNHLAKYFFLFGVIGFFITGFTFFVIKLSSTMSAYSQLSKVPQIRNLAPTPPVSWQNKAVSGKEVIAFLPSWMVGKGTSVGAKPLTQLIYFGLGVTKDGELIQFEDKVPVLEWSIFTSDEFLKLKNEAQSRNIKVLLSIKNFDNETIDKLISNQNATNNFIRRLQKMIATYHLDGVNLDFEYITDSNFPTHKYLNKFLTALSQALKAANKTSIISIDVNATALMQDAAYDMVKIGEVVDQVIVMGYDYHLPTSLIAGPVAPLSASSSSASITRSITSLTGRVPAEKIVLGVPFYGYEWQTYTENFGSYTVENTGALATYKRIKELISARADVVLHWDKASSEPWLSYKQSGAIKQIYYEDALSIKTKMSFVQERKLAGVAVWALGYEGENDDLWNSIRK